MLNDLKSLKEKKIKEVIISQSPQKNSSHIRFPQFDRFLFLFHGESFIVIFSPEKLALLFLLTELKPFPYCKLMIKLLKFDNVFRLSLKPVVDWQPLPRMHSLLLYFAGMQLPLEGSCDVVDRFKYCFERKTKTKTKNLHFIILCHNYSIADCASWGRLIYWNHCKWVHTLVYKPIKVPCTSQFIINHPFHNEFLTY